MEEFLFLMLILFFLKFCQILSLGLFLTGQGITLGTPIGAPIGVPIGALIISLMHARFQSKYTLKQH